MVIPEHCRIVQTMALLGASNFLGQQSTLFQIDEQRRASYTPAWPTQKIKKNLSPKEKLRLYSE